MWVYGVVCIAPKVWNWVVSAYGSRKGFIMRLPG